MLPSNRAKYQRGNPRGPRATPAPPPGGGGWLFGVPGLLNPLPGFKRFLGGFGGPFGIGKGHPGKKGGRGRKKPGIQPFSFGIFGRKGPRP